MNNCAFGFHQIMWTDTGASTNPPPGLYHCHYCGAPVPVRAQGDVESLNAAPVGSEASRWKLYERMRQDYRLFHMEQPE